VNLAACQRLLSNPFTGTWYRAVQLQFWNSFLATAHTRTMPGRFNAGNHGRPGVEILYFAENHQVAMFEVQALLGSPLPGAPLLPNPTGQWAIINDRVQLSQVVDLTDQSERAKIASSVQELTGDWRGYSSRDQLPSLRDPYWTNVPTQRLGHALHGVRDVEGFLTYSARVPTHRNLIVFPAKLRPGSFVEFENPITGLIDRIS
jgi:RES domain-containing protein